jgi:hypothetical protein
MGERHACVLDDAPYTTETKPSPDTVPDMSTTADDPENEESSSLFEDSWVRDVTRMGILWLIGTIIAIFLLLYVGPIILG